MADLSILGGRYETVQFVYENIGRLVILGVIVQHGGHRVVVYRIVVKVIVVAMRAGIKFVYNSVSCFFTFFLNIRCLFLP